MYDRTPEEFGIDSQESAVSKLSFSSDSSDSGSTVLDAMQGGGVPIVELPSTPPRDAQDKTVHYQSFDQILTPETIGEALEKSGTVLMQRSRENRLAQQLEEIQALMENDDELLVLQEPDTVRQMHSQPAFTQETMRSFLEHSETMFHLVHDTQAGSDMGEIIDSKEADQMDTASIDTEHGGVTHEFVSCFSKNNDMVLYKRIVTEPQNGQKRRKSIDTLIAQHAQCLAEAEAVEAAEEPTVQIYQTKSEHLLALLTFSEQSMAVMKTSNTIVENAKSNDDLKRAILQTYRQMVTRPDEMISMQTQHSKAETEQPHSHRPRSNLLDSSSKGTGSFGLSNESQSGVVLQGSSKNWKQCPDARNAAEIVTNLRLMLEEFILREIPASASVIKFLARLLSDIRHCAPVEVDEEFHRAPLIDKIKLIVDELLMPHVLEDPLKMVNQVKLTMEQILAHRIHLRTVCDGPDAWERIFTTSMGLVCELEHDIIDPDPFIEALQYGLRILASTEPENLSSQSLERKLETVSVVEQSRKKQFLSGEDPETHALQSTGACHCFTSWVLFVLGMSATWLKEQFRNAWNFLITTPPILAGPSVSFRETITDDEGLVQELHVERDHHKQRMDILRIVLQKSPSLLNAAQQSKPTPSVNERSLEMFAQLLNRSDSIVLKHSDSHHNIHLQLQGSVSGDLQKRQADDLLMLTGSIRDHAGNVAISFDTRIFDMDSLARNESAVEYITREERLSDDKDDDIEANDETKEDILIANSVVEEMIANDRIVASQQGEDLTLVDTLADEVKHCLQDLLEPVTMAVRDIQARITHIKGVPQRNETISEMRAVINGGTDTLQKSIKTQAPSTITMFVSEHPTSSSNELDVGRVSEVYNEGDMFSKISSNGQVKSHCSLPESLQELVSMFHDTNDRLAIIDGDITAIRNQLQQVALEQLQQLELLRQNQKQQLTTSKPSPRDEQRSKRRSSVNRLHSQRRATSDDTKKVGSCNTPCCPNNKNHLLPLTNQYSPVEIYSCHGVAPDVMIVHWQVDPDAIECISGYEIYVDGVLRSVCFSNKRRTTLIAHVNLRQQHQLRLHAISENHCKDTMRWAPAFFLYHL